MELSTAVRYLDCFRGGAAKSSCARQTLEHARLEGAIFAKGFIHLEARAWQRQRRAVDLVQELRRRAQTVTCTLHVHCSSLMWYLGWIRAASARESLLILIRYSYVSLVRYLYVSLLIARVVAHTYTVLERFSVFV